MRVIITESQNAILRRYGRIKELFNNYLLVHNVTAFDTFESFFQALCWDIAVDMIDRTKMDQDSYVTLRNQIIQFVRNHFYEEYKEWWERRTNRINESVDKKKKIFIDLLGEDLINSIQKITSAKELPKEFLKSLGTSKIQDYIDAYGPLYYFILDGEEFIYKDRVNPKGEEYEMFVNSKGESFLNGQITNRLGLDYTGLKFYEVIDIFSNEEDDVITEDEDKMLRNKAQRRLGFINQHVNELERDDVCKYWYKDEVEDYVFSSMQNVVEQVCDQIGSNDLYDEIYEYLVDNGYKSQFRDFFTDTHDNYC
jgi:hypothetical protein